MPDWSPGPAGEITQALPESAGATGQLVNALGQRRAAPLQLPQACIQGAGAAVQLLGTCLESPCGVQKGLQALIEALEPSISSLAPSSRASKEPVSSSKESRPSKSSP